MLGCQVSGGSKGVGLDLLVVIKIPEVAVMGAPKRRRASLVFAREFFAWSVRLVFVPAFYTLDLSNPKYLNVSVMVMYEDILQ